MNYKQATKNIPSTHLFCSKLKKKTLLLDNKFNTYCFHPDTELSSATVILMRVDAKLKMLFTCFFFVHHNEKFFNLEVL